jgi:hypothetical protein
MILEIVAALSLAVLSAAGITFLVAHALSDYKSKSEVTKRIMEKYMIDNKLKNAAENIVVPVKEQVQKTNSQSVQNVMPLR